MSGWNTIESDAGVFTELIEKIGIKGAEFENVLSIDEETLSAIQPLYGLVFLFKYRSSEYKKAHDRQESLDGHYVKDGDVYFAHQKIQNACATQAILSIVLNRQDLSIGNQLETFREFSESWDPDLKGDFIGSSEEIRIAHNSFSRPTPFIDEDDDRDHDENEDGLYHFIGYVPHNGILWELDGLLPYPISHGPCESEDFPKKLAEVLQRRVQRGPEGEIRFDAIALTADKRELLKEAGDIEGILREEQKRKTWQRENTLRRENFYSLIHQLVKGVASTKTDEQWQQTLQDGREKGKQHLEAQRANREKWQS